MSLWNEDRPEWSYADYAAPRFGATIAHLHTLSDVQAFTANYDTWIPYLRARFALIQNAWADEDSVGEAAFDRDLTGLETRYNAVKMLAAGDAFADVLLAGPILAELVLPTALFNYFEDIKGGTPADAIPAETVYQAYVTAVHQGGESSPPTPGDYLDLVERLNAAEVMLGVTPSPDPSVIQPGNRDVELDVYNRLPKTPAPDDISYWLKLIAVGVAVGIGVQVVSNLVHIEERLRGHGK